MSIDYMPVQALAQRTSFIFAYQLEEDSQHTLAATAGRYQAHLRGLKRSDLLDALEMRQAGSVPKAADDRFLWLPIQREDARRELNADLLPVADSLLNGGLPGPLAGSAAHAQATYGGDAPLRLLKEVLRGRFWIQLRPAAQARMARLGLAERAVHLGAVLEDARLHTFASGIVLLVIDLHFIDLSGGKLPLALVEEAVYALSHAADRQRPLRAVIAERRTVPEPLSEGDVVVLDVGAHPALRKATPQEIAAGAVEGPLRPRTVLRPVNASAQQQVVLLADAHAVDVDLHALAAALVGKTQGTPQGTPPIRMDIPGLREMTSRVHGRIFTYTVAICPADTPDETLEKAAYRLSRRFTTDYELAQEDLARNTLRPFDNIFHSMSIQGGALVLRSSGAKFVDGFLSSAVRPTYLPLLLLSYHEYLYLLHMTQGCAFIPDPAHPERDKERVQDLRYQLAKFRLYFRFSHISDITHHNTVHEAWRHTFALDRMLQDLSLDVREADQVLERHHREQRERRWRVGGATVGGLGGFIVTHEIAEAVSTAIVPAHLPLLYAIEHGPGHSERSEEAAHHLHQLHVAGLLLALLAGLIFAWVAWQKGPRLEE